VTGTSVSVIGTSVDGCVSDASNVITTTVNPYPSVTLSSSDPDNEICQGESITFTANPAGIDSYEFFDGATTVQNSASASWTTTGLATGNSITVEATDLGCTSVASAAIATVIIPAPTVDPGLDIDNCIDGPDVTLSGFTPAGGIWTGTGVTNPTGIFSPSSAGVGSFTLSYAVSNTNCTTTETIVANVHALPNVDAGTYGPVCLGESVNLNATGAVSYVWSPATGLSGSTISNPVSTPTATINYTVTGTDANGCVNTDVTTVNVEPVPTVILAGEDVCLDDTTNFINLSIPSTGVTYSWSFGNGETSTVQSPFVLYPTPGTFDVSLIVTLGNCSATGSISVTVNPKPTPLYLATPDYTSALEPLIQFEDLSLNAISWSWDFGDFSGLSDEQDPSHLFPDTGYHVITLTVTNTFGCTDSIRDSIFVSPFTTLYVPSAFTPDRDRINDVFYAYGADIFAIDFRVFDRWGKQLFFTDDIMVGWNGTDGKTGKEVKSGLYVYQVIYEDFRGRQLKKLGTVSLIR
jgi:gliding motility-associated-like protein